MLAQTVVQILADARLHLVGDFDDLLFEHFVIGHIAHQGEDFARAAPGNADLPIAHAAGEQILAGEGLRLAGAQRLLEVIHRLLRELNRQQLHDAPPDDSISGNRKLAVVGSLKFQNGAVFADRKDEVSDGVEQSAIFQLALAQGFLQTPHFRGFAGGSGRGLGAGRRRRGDFWAAGIELSCFETATLSSGPPVRLRADARLNCSTARG